MATDTQKERVNLSPEGSCLDGGRSGPHRGAYIKLNMRKIAIWKRWATERLTKRTIALGENNDSLTLWQVEWMLSEVVLSGTIPCGVAK
jgi:hypothetical protein